LFRGGAMVARMPVKFIAAFLGNQDWKTKWIVGKPKTKKEKGYGNPQPSSPPLAGKRFRDSQRLAPRSIAGWWYSPRLMETWE